MLCNYICIITSCIISTFTGFLGFLELFCKPLSRHCVSFFFFFKMCCMKFVHLVCNKNPFSQDGNTALHLAVLYDHLETTIVLHKLAKTHGLREDLKNEVTFPRCLLQKPIIISVKSHTSLSSIFTANPANKKRIKWYIFLIMGEIVGCFGARTPSLKIVGKF